jgi:Xaa-Pro aminopeptidase
MGKTARLLYADSERDADLYYLTHFLAGDPFLFVECEGRREVFLSDLEVDRGRREAKGVAVLRVREITDALEKAPEGLPDEPIARTARIVRRIAVERGIRDFEVPAGFPVSIADALRGLGFGVRWAPPPFLPERLRKRPDEVEHIRRAIEHTEAALRAGIERIARATVRGGGLFEGAQPLTSEAVRRTIHSALLDRECDGYQAIVAGGAQACDPHERGSGPLPAGAPIILDVFPRDRATRYHGDMTRTVVKGRASPRVRSMFAAVRDAKAAAASMLRDGVDGFDVHAAVQKLFKDAGFETGVSGGRMTGFFHGTGHGLGLDVHEPPRISKTHEILRAGNVVTVEPGLYYPDAGGVRLEDDVLVREDGCENLCTLEAVLEV